MKDARLSYSELVTQHAALERQLLELVAEQSWLLSALRLVQPLLQCEWCIAAGAIRSLVWDHLHGQPSALPAEVDVVYFEPHADAALEPRLRAALSAALPHVTWDIVNQAHAHLLGPEAASSLPFTSLQDALSAWPETATAVGVWFDSERLRVVAPLGLVDLFALRLRVSPHLRDQTAFERRLLQKRFLQRWPRLQRVG